MKDPFKILLSKIYLIQYRLKSKMTAPLFEHRLDNYNLDSDIDVGCFYISNRQREYVDLLTNIFEGKWKANKKIY